MNKEMFEALEELSIEKGINKDYILEAIETALVTAYKRNFNSSENVKIVIDEEHYTINVYSLKEVVEVKPMDEEEAILQMELLGHDFYLFKTCIIPVLQVECNPLSEIAPTFQP